MSDVKGWDEPEVLAEYTEQKAARDAGASVPWEDRAAYMRQTQQLIRALTRSLDAAQEGKHIDLEVDELLEVQHKTLNTYDRIVDATSG